MKPDEVLIRSFYLRPSTDQASKYRCAGELETEVQPIVGFVKKSCVRTLTWDFFVLHCSYFEGIRFQ